jgi:uncharacterized membrane protein
MPAAPSPPANPFLRLHPLHRVLLGLSAAAGVWLLLRQHTTSLILATVAWCAFALVYTVCNWAVLLTRSVPQIRSVAKKQDGSAVFVFLMILMASFASLLIVLLLLLSKDAQTTQSRYLLPAIIAGCTLSWTMVHTVFTFHYAHRYYDDGAEGKERKGLDFPGDEEPDYLDFAYFAFVIGCTFQVSDVEITAKAMRRLVLVHGLISYVLNTFVVALMINLIAGLTK